jgi:hypothetical protein
VSSVEVASAPSWKKVERKQYTARNILGLLRLWHYWLWSFKTRDTKLE